MPLEDKINENLPLDQEEQQLNEFLSSYSSIKIKLDINERKNLLDKVRINLGENTELSPILKKAYFHFQENEELVEKYFSRKSSDEIIDGLPNSVVQKFKSIIGFTESKKYKNLQQLLQNIETEKFDFSHDNLQLNLDILKDRYGFEVCLENESDIADLIHVDFHRDLSEYDARLSGRLREYLQNVRKNYIDSKDMPEIDDITNLYRGYNQSRMLNEIVIALEKRKYFKQLNLKLKGNEIKREWYQSTLNEELDDIISNLKRAKSTNSNESSHNIVNHLFNYYSDLKECAEFFNEFSKDKSKIPRFYQLESIIEIRNKKRMLIADDMGTGKTLQSVLAVPYIEQKEKKDIKTLVITPHSNKSSFQEKIIEDLNINENEVYVLNGGSKRDYKTITDNKFVIINYDLLRQEEWSIDEFYAWNIDEENRKTHEQYFKRILSKTIKKETKQKRLINKIATKIKKELGEEKLYELSNNELLDLAIISKDIKEKRDVANSLINNTEFDYVIVDEAHNGKNQHSLNAKAIKKVCDQASYVSLLSGTPFVSSVSDLSPQLHILGIYEEFKKDIKEKILKNEDHDIDSANKLLNNVDTLKGLEEILGSKVRFIRDYLRPKLIRRESDEVLNLPEIEHFKDDLIDFDYEQRLLYEYLFSFPFNDRFSKLQSLRKVSVSPGMLNSNVPDDEKLEEKLYLPIVLPELFDDFTTDDKSTKYKWLLNYIKQNPNEKIVVFSSQYRRGVTIELEEILKNEGVNTYRIDGTVDNSKLTQFDKEKNKKISKREKVRTEFCDSKNGVLVTTLATSKEAIDLSKANTVVFLDQPYTWAEFEQAYKRVWRDGQLNKVKEYSLIARNSIDEGVYNLIIEKQKLGNLFIKGAPLNEKELKILNTDLTKKSHDFVQKHINIQKKILNTIFSRLVGQGYDNLKEIIGSETLEAKFYADRYLTAGVTKHTLSSVIDTLSENNIITKDSKILDLCSGHGYLSFILDKEIDCLELNPYMIKWGKQISEKANYKQAGMHEVSSLYSKNSYDSVVHSLGLHHASNSEGGKTIKGVHDVLKQDGLYVLIEPEAIVKNSNLEEALRYTGFEIIENKQIKTDNSPLRKILAKKSKEGKLYKKKLGLKKKFTKKESESQSQLDYKSIEKLYELRDKVKVGYAT
jgi:SNF2 family DNA or RNA helicase/ubiquinone/menaquinone biosynthesis C-methylase UbiE